MTRSGPALGIGAAAFVATLIHAGAAFAEVCDKMAPQWDPMSGRTTVLGEAVRAAASPVYLTILGLTALAVAIGKPLLAYTVGIVCFVFAAGVFILDDRHNEIARSAIREGCITGQPVLEAIYAAVGLLAILAAWKARQRRA